MQLKPVYKAVVRDIYFHKGRSLITFTALFLVIAFPIAMFSTGPSIKYSNEINNEDYHLAHLDFILGPFHEDHIHNITGIVNDTLGRLPDQIAPRLKTRTKLFYGSNFYSVDSIGVNSSENMEINQVEVREGTLELNEGEIAIISSFAEHLNVTIGDNLTLNLNERNATFEITGIIQSVEYVAYDLMQIGAVYLNETDLRNLMLIPPNYYNEILIYFQEGISNDEIKECGAEIRDYLIENHIPILLIWHTRSFSVSSTLTDVLNLTSSYLTTSAILIVIIVGIVIFIITKRYAMEQRKQTGMLYSYGFDSKTILFAFLLRTLILCILAIIFGIIGGIYLLKFLTGFLGNMWGMIHAYSYLSPLLVVEIVIITLVISLFFTYWAARENIKLTPYEAIRGKVKEFVMKRSENGTAQKLPLSLKVPFRNISRGKMRSVMTVLAFGGAIMLSFSLINTQTNLAATREDYFTKSSWDINVQFNTLTYSGEIYKNLSDSYSFAKHEPILETFVQFADRSDQIIKMRGVSSNSSLIIIDIQEGTDFSSEIKPEVIMSQFSAEKLGVSIGDNISFYFLNREINMTIVGLSRSMDFPVTMYVQLESLEEIFGFKPINAMLIDIAGDSQAEIDKITNELNNNEDVSLAVTREFDRTRIRNIIASQTIIINIMVVLGLIVSFLSIFATTYIVVIERDREYALQRVFGFSSGQILTQIFLEIFLLSVIALVIGFFAGNYLSRYWMNLVKKYFFSVDNYFIFTDYLTLFGFALATSIFSLMPEYKSLRKSNLAESIREE